MNVLDIGIILIVALCAWGGYRRGLIRSVYRLVSFFVAVLLSHRLYPYVAGYLRETQLFPMIQEGISRGLNFEAIFYEHAVGVGSDLIDMLPIPGGMRAMLHTNNTADMFQFLQVSTIEDYITGFFSNMVINALAMVAVFVIALIALSLVGYALDIVGMLPVIRTLNRAGGLILGIAMGAILVWLSVLVMTLFFATGASETVYILLQESLIARLLFEVEFLLPSVAGF